MKYLDEDFYHVFNRGSRSEEIFFSDANYKYFYRLLNKNADVHFVHIAAYCLMPNHYHLVLQQKTNGSISKFIQSVMTSYVQAINKKYHTSGTLFQGKAKAKLIDSDGYILQVIRYIHLNPVSARLVKAPEDWPFSDYREWIKDTNPTSFGDRRGTDSTTNPTASSDRIDTSKLTVTSNRRDILRNKYFTKAYEYQQFVEEYQIERQNNKLDKFLFKEK